MARDPEKSARRIRAAGPAARGSPPAATSPPTAPPAGRPRARASSSDLGLGAGAVVTSYVAVPGEPPTAALNAALAGAGIRVLLPVTLPDLDLDWCDASRHRRRPARGWMPSPLADLVLAPGLAVDPRGTRMGQGGGCYDRALPRRRPGVPVVVLLHPGELLDPDEPPLPRRDARPAGRRRRDRRRASSTSGSAGRRPSGRRVSTSGSVSRTAASVNGHGRCRPATQSSTWSS